MSSHGCSDFRTKADSSAPASTKCVAIANTRSLSSFGSSVSATVVKHLNAEAWVSQLASSKWFQAHLATAVVMLTACRTDTGPTSCEIGSPINEPAAAFRFELVHDLRHTTWLILPVVICLFQRLSHACLSIRSCTAKLRMAH